MSRSNTLQTLYMQDQATKGAHAEGMKQILRLRGPHQMYGARGWSLFRLAHHRLVGSRHCHCVWLVIAESDLMQQCQNLAFNQEPMAESELWLESLNEEIPFVQIEKHNFQISQTCQRANTLLNRLDITDSSVDEILAVVQEMRALDQESLTWRMGPEWEFKTINVLQLSQNPTILTQFPATVELHRDIWIAYEWNYHRTARIMLHQKTLQCLDRLPSGPEPQSIKVAQLKQESISIVQGLADQILATVPQTLGDIDCDGNVLSSSDRVPECRAIGAYFLLWPIKILKSLAIASSQQRADAKEVFERIRQYTGMKATLQDLSNI
jgi:hypothetical protein